MTIAPAKWSVATYRHLSDAGLLADCKVELVAGEVLKRVSEGSLHRYTLAGAQAYLQQRLGDRALVLPPGPIELPGSDSEPEPDLAIVAPLGSAYKTRLPQPTDICWLVEISGSTLTYDLGRKAALYAAHRIQEYWVLDMRAARLWVHRNPVADLYTLKTAHQAGTVAPLAFPKLGVSVARLFA